MIIKLDLKADSSLKWDEAKKEAETGESDLIFNLDLGLFKKLKAPLSDETQFLTLTFAIEHFVNHFLPPFLSKTKGVILYDGECSFIDQIPWSLEEEEGYNSTALSRALYAHKLGIDFLRALLAPLPTNLTPFLRFERGELSLPQLLRYTAREYVDPFEILPKINSLSNCSAKEGMLLPETTSGWEKFEKSFHTLPQGLRVISPTFFTEEWDGIETLYLVEEVRSRQLQRKIAGFIAASGKIVEMV